VLSFFLLQIYIYTAKSPSSPSLPQLGSPLPSFSTNMAEVTNPTNMTIAAASEKQAGGGVSEAKRIIKAVDQTVLTALRRVYESHAASGQKWSADQTKAFLHSVQRHEPAEPATRSLAGRELDFQTFLNYMASESCAATIPPRPEDLNWPLASYFISSSHNTYLSGNQLSSDSTTEAYTNVLRRGCRCVEVDVWDGDDSDSSDSDSDDPNAKKNRSWRKRSSGDSGIKARGTINFLKEKLARVGTSKKDGGKTADPVPASADTTTTPASASVPEVAVIEPRVLHGYTLTKEISFRDVCIAIKESAFAVTDLPLIVSLEVHCSHEQQLTMVSIMRDIWGDLLAVDSDANVKALPSPHQLRRKILVKVKYVPPDTTSEEDSADDDRLALEKSKTKKKPAKIIQELSQLGTYCHAISFKSFAQPEATMPAHIFSLAEKKFLDFVEDKDPALAKHNRDYLLRAYPSGLRVGSSNLNPAPFWGAGAQIVALNWQQSDEGMMLNEGMFAGTGGYVLKPPGYLPERENSIPNKIVHKTLTLAVTFLAAQNIPIPPDDKSVKSFRPYIKVEIHVDASQVMLGGHIKNDGHEREGDYKERTKTHKGINLDLQSEKLVFNQIPCLVEELTFVRFTVRDDEIGKDDLAAWACVRLDRLGEGYRFIHLIDLNGKLTEGAVLVKIEKKLA
jgi:phosphatidylinositol phospholipase C delta